MKKVINAHILYRKDEFSNADEFKLAMFEMESCGFITVREQEFEVDIPDDFDPRSKQIEILQKEQERINAEFQKRCTAIQEQINRLTALEFT
jgi:hypothetical protein